MQDGPFSKWREKQTGSMTNTTTLPPKPTKSTYQQRNATLEVHTAKWCQLGRKKNLLEISNSSGDSKESKYCLRRPSFIQPYVADKEGDQQLSLRVAFSSPPRSGHYAHPCRLHILSITRMSIVISTSGNVAEPTEKDEKRRLSGIVLMKTDNVKFIKSTLWSMKDCAVIGE